MKKLICSIILIAGTAFAVNAQTISDNALGLRLGDSGGFGAEISYQRAVGANNNRLELDLGIRDDDHFNAFQLTGIYQWVWNIDGGFNWYAGPGAGIGFYNFDEEFPTDNENQNETYFFIAGDVGIEYNFDIPLMLSLDFRPEFVFNDYDDDMDFDIALGIRYQF